MLSPIKSSGNPLLQVKHATREVKLTCLETDSESQPVFTEFNNLESLYRCKKKRVTQTGAETKVARFIALLKLLSTAPWAPLTFNVNESMIARLTASHLPLIVGAAQWKNERTSLLELIGPDLEDAQNVVWVTNRQQGKTTTLSKFVAALSLVSPVGGNLFCVYSTNLDRAQELTRAAKKYLYWLQSDPAASAQLHSLDIPSPAFVQDNERVYSLAVGNIVNTVLARPKSADSCRGDAPRAAVFDEIAFVSADFWFKVSPWFYVCSLTLFLILLSLSSIVCIPPASNIKKGLHMCNHPSPTRILLCDVLRAC